MRKLFGLAILTPVLVLVWASNVLAGDTFCPPDPGPVKVSKNIIVDDEVCTLAGTRVKGNVIVEPGGALIVTVGTRIQGDVKCDGCNSLGILGGTIKGDVTIMNASGGAIETIGHDDTAGPIRIFGDVKYEENSARLFARVADIGGDLTVLSNTRLTNAPQVDDNTIAGDLKCEENDLAPIPGMVGNIVDGEKKGQCTEDLGF